MKHIWAIDDINYVLHEGYVMDDYKEHHDGWDFVYGDDNRTINLGSFTIENIFEDKLKALNVYEGIIRIEISQIYKEIDKLNRKNEILFEKLLDIKNL